MSVSLVILRDDVCAKINAKLRSTEEECESLRRTLSVEVDGRRELEGILCSVCMLALYFSSFTS